MHRRRRANESDAAPPTPQTWLPERNAPPPTRAAAAPTAPTAPTAIAIRIGELAVRCDRARSSLETGADLRGGVRIDALVCTRSTHRAETCVARTLGDGGAHRALFSTPPP